MHCENGSNYPLRPFGCDREQESAGRNLGEIIGTDGTSIISPGSDMTRSERRIKNERE